MENKNFFEIDDDDLEKVSGGSTEQVYTHKTIDGRDIQLGPNSPSFTCPWCGGHWCFTTYKGGPLLCHDCEWNETKGWAKK